MNASPVVKRQDVVQLVYNMLACIFGKDIFGKVILPYFIQWVLLGGFGYGTVGVWKQSTYCQPIEQVGRIVIQSFLWMFSLLYHNPERPIRGAGNRLSYRDAPKAER